MNVIKSYLVSLGFSVNNQEFTKVNQALSDFTRNVHNTTSEITKSFSKASMAITGSITGITTATAGLIDHVGQLDMSYQKFALRMYMTTEQAKQLKIVTEAMGENINDIAWIPELRQRYFSLMGQTGQLESQMGGDTGNVMKSIRDMRFEVTRLKVEATYAVQWIAYYLIKDLSGVFGGLKGGLKGVNDYLTTNMPIWTRKVARFLEEIILGIKSLIEYLFNLKDKVVKLWQELTPLQQKLIKIFTLIAAFLSSGPTGKLLLLAGAFSYLKQEIDHSAEAQDTWNKIQEKSSDIVKALEKNTFPQLNRLWDNLKETLSDTGEALDKLWGKMFPGQEKLTGWQKFWHAVDYILAITIDLVNALVTGFHQLILMLQFDFKGALEVGRKQTEESLKLWRKINRSLKGGDDESTSGGLGSTRSWGGIGGGDFESFINAIAGQEGNDYGATNERTGAYGRFQIMPENWPSWSQEILGYVAEQTPENQETVARGKLQQYYDKYGARGAAIAWYGGEGALNYSDYALNRPQGSGDEPSLNEYANSVLGRMGGSSNMWSTGASNYAETTSPSSYNYPTGNSAYDSSVSTGDINIAINQPAASASEIKYAVLQGIQEAQNTATARQIREFSGVSIA